MSYAGHPLTIGEIRAGQNDDPAAWSPRDMLIYLLREIDSGKLHPEDMVVAFRNRDPDHGLSSQVIQASRDIHVAIGLAFEAACQLRGAD